MTGSSAPNGTAALATVLSGINRDMLACRNDLAVENAAELLATILGVSHVMVLRLVPAADGLLLQAGIGWPADMVGQTRFDTDPGTLLGLALASSEPVVVHNFPTDTRCILPAPLAEYRFASALCARIPCQHETVRVLAAFSAEPRRFTPDEVSCLRVVAGMLAVSDGCQHTCELRRVDQQHIEQTKLEWEATVDALPHFICLVDEHKRIVRANRSIEHWVNGPICDVCGHTVHEILHPDCTDPACYMLSSCATAWELVQQGGHFEFEVEDKVLKRHLAVQLRPTTSRHPGIGVKQTSLAVVVLEDITRIKHAEEVLRSSNDRLEHLVQARMAELSQANERLRCEVAERRRIAEELRASENAMRLLSAQVLTAQEMERKRIASELHDGIGQSLSAIKFSVENAIALAGAEPGELVSRLVKSVIPKLQSAIDEVRRISMDLRPSTLDDLGIIPTIAWFCREFRSIYRGIQLDTHVALTEHDVPAPLKTVIFRILQEAMNNIVRHARAESVRVDLCKADSAIELVVRDDGVGFDVQAPAPAQGKASRRGLGIVGMRERVEFSGGTFFIGPGEDRGMVVRASWPCRAEATHAARPTSGASFGAELQTGAETGIG